MINKIIICFFVICSSWLTSAEFTISSFNCGGLSNHYDYLRAATMQKLMQERYTAEPAMMALNEKVQRLALKLLFDPTQSSMQEWEQHKNALNKLMDEGSQAWKQKSEQMITNYTVRPVVLNDSEVKQMLDDHLQQADNFDQRLQLTRAKMAQHIFNHHLKFDIICIQEGDYLNADMFPAHYAVEFCPTSHSVNGIAWNKERFELVDIIGNIKNRAYAIQLLDKETQKTILVASGHITGCNPYKVENNDSAKGDSELQAIIDLFDKVGADLLLIGMDSNVTSLHPRLQILKGAGYHLDAENFIEPTCTNPNLILNTRIDWIALKAANASITNIPILSIGLNNLQTNISDHAPIAAKISY